MISERSWPEKTLSSTSRSERATASSSLVKVRHDGLRLGGLSTTTPIGVDAAAVLRLALAKADADVVLACELECDECGGEDAFGPLVLPLPNDGGVGGAPVVVRHQVPVLAFVVVHGVGNAAVSKTAVDGVGLYIHLRSSTVRNLGNLTHGEGNERRKKHK